MSADGETGDGIDTNVVQSLVARRMFDPDAELYRIGRFAVLERLGTGGMGVVYGAYDPELDRRVAVKLLFDDGDDGGRAAAVREAQAMARLADPNVAAVYEVGIHKGRTFVAMQHVRGQNLRRWAQAQPRALPEILAVYRQAALGLAAAHEVGVVHRDFKPDNALVDDDGRVRVVDFGLASIDAGLRTPSEAASLGDPEHESTDPLTARRGGGTPAYMAAEQFGGEPGDARCDQFAWCVSLWEACVGARPFAGHDFASLVAAVRDDRILEPPPRRLPRWLAKLLRRGLAAEPGARYRDMRQLVAALDRGRRSARRRPWVIAGIAVVAIAGALVVHDRVQQIRRAAACDDDAAIADASWPGAHDEVRVGVRDVVERELGDDAAATLARVEPTLDGYVASWRELAAERCRAWTVEAHEPTLAAAALRCLHERRAVLDTLLARVQEGDAAVLRRAIKAVHALPPLDGCGDPEALRRRGALGERDPEAVAAVRDRVARSRGLQLAGDIAAARDEGEQARADAIAVEWPPVLAEAELQLGSALEASGAYAESESVLADAYMTARACDSSLVAMDAAIALGVVIGSRQARAEEGLRWVRLAEVEYQRLGSPPSLSATRLYNSESAIYFATGDLDAALAQSEKALALREQLLAADDPEIAQSLANLGAIRFRRGDLEEARSLLRRALTQCRDSLGPDHFDCVNFAANLGGIAQTLGDYDEAETALRDAMRIREHVLGPDHPDFASSLGDIAALRMLAGDYLGARELDERALAIVRKIHGEGHPLLAPFMSRLSSDDYALGRFELARDEIAESVAMRERHLGADAIDTALARIDLGACELALQHTHEALREGERALPVIEAAMGAADPNVARALLLIGGAHKLRGEHATALPLFERAVALLDAAPVPAHERAAGHFQLAEVLWASAPARARELATRALAEYSEVGFQGDRERNEVRAWIAAHP